MSFKSGQREVYVTPFPGRETEHRVSTAGGSLPRWNRDGKELFYLALDNTLRVTAVDGRTSRFSVGAGGRFLRSVHVRHGSTPIRMTSPRTVSAFSSMRWWKR